MNTSNNKWTLLAHEEPTEDGLFWFKYFPLPTDGYRRELEDDDRLPILLRVDGYTDFEYELNKVGFQSVFDDDYKIPISRDEIAWMGPIEVVFTKKDISVLNRQQLAHFSEHKMTKCWYCKDVREITSKKAARYLRPGVHDGPRGRCNACGKRYALELIYKHDMED